MKKYSVLFGIFLLVACSGQKSPSAASSEEESQHAETVLAQGPETEAHEHEEGEHEDVLVSSENQQAWGIEVANPTTENLEAKLSLPGVLELNLNKTAYISSFIAGKVASLAVDLGSRVRAGQILCAINSPEFSQAQTDFLETRAKMLLSQKEYERAQKLFEEKAIEEKEYLRREAEYNALITEYAARESTLHSYGLTHEHMDTLIARIEAIKDKKYMSEATETNLPILSPSSGTVVYRDVVLGESVDAQKTLFTISDLSTLWAILDAYEKDLPYFSKDSTVDIESPLYPGKTFKGKITYISDLIDKQLRTIKIRVAVDNSEGLLKPNMYIQGKIETFSEEPVYLAIPDEAVQNLGGEKIVFVLEAPEVFTVKHVIPGLKIGSQRIITAGLSPEDIVAVKGAFYLKAEMTKATFGHAHVH